MIRGYKPSGYTLSYTREGRKLEGETRQCVHCQYTWAYGEPHGLAELDSFLGHPTLRGFCTHCHGFLCGRRQCFEQQMRLRALLNLEGNCIPYTDWIERTREKIAALLPLDPDLTLTPTGLVVPVAKERPPIVGVR